MSATRQILVVDDDPLVNDFLQTALRKLGHEITTAQSAQAAFAGLEKTEFDLVITDLKMPNISGMELLKHFRQESPDTVVVMITAYGTPENAREAQRFGVFDFLLKPIDLNELEIVIARALVYRDLILENCLLKSQAKGKYDLGQIIGSDKKLLDLLRTLNSAAQSRATVLIQGESGTGKELLARAIHYNSPRSEGPFIKLNCAALPEGLTESELFGHEKGAFTGAIKQSRGRFELADRGTLLLDEISEMPIGVQAKLLRVIQEREFERVGSGQPLQVDVRLVATTNRRLEEEVMSGRFRDDLFYRLNVIPIFIPPLRARTDDIPLLTEHFIRKYNQENSRQVRGVTEKGMKLLMKYHWPGNIRELENYIERAVVLCRDDRITEADLPGYLALGNLAPETLTSFNRDLSIAEMEKLMILTTLERYQGNRTKAAEVLDISSRTLRNKLHEYGLMGNAETREETDEAARSNE